MTQPGRPEICAASFPGRAEDSCTLTIGHTGAHQDHLNGVLWSDSATAPPAEPAQPATTQPGDTLAHWLEYRGLPPSTTLSQLIAAERDTARLAGVFDHIAEERRKGAPAGDTERLQGELDRALALLDHAAATERRLNAQLECAAAGLTPEQTIRHHALTEARLMTDRSERVGDPEAGAASWADWLRDSGILDLADHIAAYIRDGSRP